MNTDLIERVLTLIDLNPSKWDQGSWQSGGPKTPEDRERFNKSEYELCGTTGCAAGWGMMLSGEWEPVLGTGHFADDVVNMMHVASGLDVNQMADAMEMNTDKFYVHTAAELFGITYDQGWHIFIDMDYDVRVPHRFTDAVRDYLGMPKRWYDDDWNELPRPAAQKFAADSIAAAVELVKNQ